MEAGIGIARAPHAGSQLICRQDRVLINAETFSINIKESLISSPLLLSHDGTQLPIIRSTAAAIIMCVCTITSETFCTWTFIIFRALRHVKTEFSANRKTRWLTSQSEKNYYSCLLFNVMLFLRCCVQRVGG